MKKNLNTVFMGTGSLGLKCLPYLFNNSNLKAIFTSVDSFQGRKQSISIPKDFALNNSIPLFQILSFDKNKDPESFEKVSLFFKENPIHWIIVSDYGLILKKWILDIPQYAAINIHASLLPRYRGSSCIQAALLNNDEETGITIQKMALKLDAGAILHQERLKITEKDNYNSLKESLSFLAKKGLENLLQKDPQSLLAEAKEQDPKQVSYCSKVKKEDARILWSKTAKRIKQEVKAYSDWPRSYFFYNQSRILIFEVEVIKQDRPKAKEGTLLKFDKEGIWIQTAEEILSLIYLQKEGKKKLFYKDFVLGNRWPLAIELK